MSRLVSALSLSLLTAIALSADPVPKIPADPTKDREGNALPKGATARLGSLALRGPSLYGLSFSPDSKTLRAIPDSGRMLIWDAETGRPLPAKELTPIKGGQVSLTGAIAGERVIWISTPFASAQREESTAIVYSLTDGKKISQFSFPSDHPYFNSAPHSIGTASVTPDGKYLAVVGEREKSVDVYDLDSGKRLHTQQARGKSGATVYASPDAKTLYMKDTDTLRRFELTTGKELPAVADIDRFVDLLISSPDGKRLVTRGTTVKKDENGKVVANVREQFLVVRDTVANNTIGRLELGGYPQHFGFAGPDAVIVLAAKVQSPLPIHYTISRWDLTTLQRDWEVVAPPFSEAFQELTISPDGKRFALSDRHCIAHVYDAATGKRLVESSGHAAPVAWVGFTPNGERVTTIAPDGLRTWALNGERKTAAGLPELTRGRVQASLLGERLVWVAHTEDGKKTELVGWDQDKSEIGWRMFVEKQPERVLTHDGKRCLGFTWNPMGRAWDVAVYDGPAGKKLHTWTLDSALSEGFMSWPPMAVSADGKRLYVGGKQAIIGLDANSGKEEQRIDAGLMKPDQSPAFTMAVSANGSRIAVVVEYANTPNRGLQVFDLKSGKKLAEHTLGRSYLPALRFSPNGKSVAVWNVWSTGVLLCDAESSQTEPRKLEGGTYRATCAAFSPNGAELVVGYQDGTALVWNLAKK